jgi:CRP-like cAMP-binding protein
MYIIKEGSVIIEKAINEKERVTLAELSKGDCFGEMALFDAELRSASVQAKEPCVLLCIKSDDLNDLLLSYPSIAIEFLKTFVRRLRKANESIEKLSAEKKE